MGRYKKTDSPQRADKDKLAQAMGYASDEQRKKEEAAAKYAQLAGLFPMAQELQQAKTLFRRCKDESGKYGLSLDEYMFCMKNGLLPKSLRIGNPMQCRLTKIQLATLAPLFLQHFDADCNINVEDFFMCRQPMHLKNNALFFYFMEQLADMGLIARTWRSSVLLINSKSKRIERGQISKTIGKFRNDNHCERPKNAAIVDNIISSL